jgi:hypothetical protein
LHKNDPKLIFIVDKTEIKSIKPLQVEQHAPLNVGAVTVMTSQKPLNAIHVVYSGWTALAGCSTKPVRY